MSEIALKIDRAAQKVLTAFCALALLGMVLFAIYTVFMRYVLLAPRSGATR